MNLILAIIQPSKLEAVKEALNRVKFFASRSSTCRIGRQKGHSEVYRGHELTVNLLRKVQLQIAVNEDLSSPRQRIMEAGRTGAEDASATVRFLSYRWKIVCGFARRARPEAI